MESKSWESSTTFVNTRVSAQFPRTDTTSTAVAATSQLSQLTLVQSGSSAGERALCAPEYAPEDALGYVLLTNDPACPSRGMDISDSKCAF
jgi:hypothetical protein